MIVLETILFFITLFMTCVMISKVIAEESVFFTSKDLESDTCEEKIAQVIINLFLLFCLSYQVIFWINYIKI